MSTRWRPARVRGMYEDQLWEYIGNDDLRLQRSESSGELRYPPGPVCPETLDPEHTWEPVAGTATLLAWTVFRRAYFPEIPLPYTVVAVRSLEGPIFVGHLAGDVSKTLTHGMAMRLVYEDVSMAEDQTRIFNWVPEATTPINRTTSEKDHT